MKGKIKRRSRKERGSVLALVVISLIMLIAVGTGLLAISYGVRQQALRIKNEAIAMLAAEAGYERAVFWMSQQEDMLSALQNGAAGSSGTLQLTDGQCDYSIQFDTFIGARPVYKIVSNGHSGTFNRTVEVSIVQAISGWDMGMCRIPSGSGSTTPVSYVTGEVIDMPLHINNLNDSPDSRDIYISGTPQFLREAAMGESRYTSGGSDKYAGVMGLFASGGIYFNQPDSRVTDEASVQSKIDRFKNSTNPLFIFTPTAPAAITLPSGSFWNTYAQPAVHLEFYVQGGVGKVRITNNCTVCTLKLNSDSITHDFRIKPNSGGTQYERYPIYTYHVRATNADSLGYRFIRDVTQSYVSQSIGGVQSTPGGQIFVEGNVIIDCNALLPSPNTVMGKITVVAGRKSDGSGGNIWVANSIAVAGTHDANSLPSASNPNVLGLIAQSVVKVVDPGLSSDTKHSSPYNAKCVRFTTISQPSGYTYVPIGVADSSQPSSGPPRRRHLPNPEVVEAAMTAGGGGWGAENVGIMSGSNYYCGRKETSSSGNDNLYVRGTLVEAVRGVVGYGTDGYLKKYYLDERLLEGVLPGDMWLRGKYIPSPAGWHDYTGN